MEEKKSIFEKLRLVDKIEKQDRKEEEKPVDAKEQKVENHEKNENDKNDLTNKNTVKVVNSTSHLGDETKSNPLKVKEIYEMYEINNKNDVFLIDSYLKALPESLPTDVKRQCVLNIIKVSEMNIEDLLKDGENRLKVLNSYANKTTMETEKIIKGYEAKIQELYNKIDEYKNIISERNNFQDEQKAYIDYEIQKINRIIDFIK